MPYVYNIYLRGPGRGTAQLVPPSILLLTPARCWAGTQDTGWSGLCSVVTSGVWVQCRAMLVSPSSSALSSCYLGCNHLSSIADIKWVLWRPVSTGYSVQGRWPLSTGQYTGCRGQLSSGRVPGQQWQCRAVGGWSQCRQHVMVSTVTSLNTEQPQVTGARCHLSMNSNIFIRY